MNKEDLKNYVEKHPKLISRKQSISYPELFILKYKNNCFYNNIWNQYIVECRGLVVDKDYNIVINPFTKIFNYGIEKNAPVIHDDEEVIAIRKVNGFMAAASIYKGELVVSTTGSLDSDYAKLAKEMINKLGIFKIDGTILFEIVHSSDPHIIPEKEGVYFLGTKPNQYNSKIDYVNNFEYFKSAFNNEYKDITLNNIIYPEVIILKFDDLKEKVKNIKHEGYVIYTQDGRSTKIKSPYYLFKKFLARGNTDKIVWQNAKKRFPEEFYGVIDNVQENIKEFSLLSEQDRLQYIREQFYETKRI